MDQGMDSIDVAEDRDKCQALLNTAMNFRVLYNEGNFWAR
jgi:hypothetical protein